MFPVLIETVMVTLHKKTEAPDLSASAVTNHRELLLYKAVNVLTPALIVLTVLWPAKI